MLPPPRPCRPPFWARGGHAQTLLGHLLPSRVPALPWERLNLKLPDGDALRVLLARGHSEVVVYLFHGLGGSSDSGYVRRAAAHFWRQGHSVLAINHRGAGEGRLLAKHPYHLGSTADMAALIQVGRGFFPEYCHVAIGYSLSATALLLLLGRDRSLGLAQPDRAIAVSPVLDPQATSLCLTQGFRRLYDFLLLRRARRALKERQVFGLLEDTFQVPRCATLRAFDDAYTAGAAGFRDLDDYLSQCACGPHLPSIRTPTVILTAQDDPVCGAQELLTHPRSPSVHLHLERTGGHMGFLGRDAKGYRWLEFALDHFLKELTLGPTRLVPAEQDRWGLGSQTAFLVVERVDP